MLNTFKFYFTTILIRFFNLNLSLWKNIISKIIVLIPKNLTKFAKNIFRKENNYNTLYIVIHQLYSILKWTTNTKIWIYNLRKKVNTDKISLNLTPKRLLLLFHLANTLFRLLRVYFYIVLSSSSLKWLDILPKLIFHSYLKLFKNIIKSIIIIITLLIKL